MRVSMRKPTPMPRGMRAQGTPQSTSRSLRMILSRMKKSAVPTEPAVSTMPGRGMLAGGGGVGGGTGLGEGQLLFGGRRDEAFGDGGEALLAFELAGAGARPAGDGDDAEDHEADGDGDDEGAVGGVAEGGEGCVNHGWLLVNNFWGWGAGRSSLVSVGLRLREGAKVSGAGMKLLEDDEVLGAG